METFNPQQNTILYLNKYFYLKGGSEGGMFKDRDIARTAGYNIADISQLNPLNEPSLTQKYFTKQIPENGLSNKLKILKNMFHNAEVNSNICNIIRHHKPSAVHAHNIYHQFSPSIFRTIKSLGLPIILTLHDYKITCPKYTHFDGHTQCYDCANKVVPLPILFKGCENNSIRKYTLFFETTFHRLIKSYNYVDRFIAPSSFIANLVAKQVDPKKIILLRNEFDPARSISDVEVPEDDFYLFCGRCETEKGIVPLIKLFRNNPDKKLIILGEGSQVSFTSELPKNIIFKGKVDSNTVFAYMKKANSVIFPSLWPENASYAVLEALHYAKKVIVNNVGGMPEQVRPYPNGFCIDLSDPNEIDQIFSISKRVVVTEASVNNKKTYRDELLKIYEDTINAKYTKTK